MKFKKALASKIEAIDEAGYETFDYFWPFFIILAVGVPLLIFVVLVLLGIMVVAKALSVPALPAMFAVTVVPFVASLIVKRRQDMQLKKEHGC